MTPALPRRPLLVAIEIALGLIAIVGIGFAILIRLQAIAPLDHLFEYCETRLVSMPGADLSILDRDMATAAESVSWFPLGIDCKWLAPDSSVGFELPQTDLGPTIKAGVSLAAGIAALAVLCTLLLRERRRSRTPAS